MAKTRDNHYVPQWYQKGFMDYRANQLCHFTHREITLSNGEVKVANSTKWYTSAQSFYGVDLYSTFFGAEVDDNIEKELFGPIDENGSKSVRAFITDDKSQWHNNFQDFFIYLDAQKLRTPKGLDWIKSKYSQLTQEQLMVEMQSLRTMHCTLWAEGVREFVSAENSEVKFIISDHPVTIYNYASPPESELCRYPNEPDITLKGTQTIFPLDKNRCLILTNLEYAQDPDNTNPLEQRTNATRLRNSMVNTINFINERKLTTQEVIGINYIIKSRAKTSIAAGREEWLCPVNDENYDWAGFRSILLPPSNQLHQFGGEMFAHFEDGSVHYQDAFGRTTRQSDFLNKDINENRLRRNDLCGCGSGLKYKKCCLNTPADLRTTWSVASIRERNLAFCDCIKDVLGLNAGKTWLDVRKELNDEQIKTIYEFYSLLWPRETDVYALLPKSDGKFRGLYSGVLDARVIDLTALPMASIFDEVLIENPVVNPNNIKPEFNPIVHPGRYKYQALKDFLFMLESEPYIGLGFINLIPDPSEFDMALKSAMFDMARERGSVEKVFCEQEQYQHFLMAIEDLLNTTAMLPREVRVQVLVKEFGLSEMDADHFISEMERNAEACPLVLLQKTDAGKRDLLLQFRTAPNYEMALLIAQITGSVIVTDSRLKWQEFMSAQHRELGVASYPWDKVLKKIKSLPIDKNFLNNFNKSQGCFDTVRNILRDVDGMVLGNNHNIERLNFIECEVLNFIEQLNQVAEPLLTKSLSISSPNGGFYDANVQRLLIRSSCLKYDSKVRSIYGLDLP